MDPATAILISAGVSAAGQAAGFMGAQSEQHRRAAAIAAALRKIDNLNKRQMLAEYKAGGIQQGELLKHLTRLAAPGFDVTNREAVAARTTRAATAAGPNTAPTVAPNDPRAAAYAAARRTGTAVGRLDLARALLAQRGQATADSGALSNVAASRAVVPLNETRADIARAIAKVQAQLGATMGTTGSTAQNLGLASSVLNAGAAVPWMFVGGGSPAGGNGVDFRGTATTPVYTPSSIYAPA